MAKKLKLTAEQVKKIQEYKDKRVKITETQYQKLKEMIDSAIPNLTESLPNYKPTPKFSTPAAKLTKQFNRAANGAGVKGFKAENEKLTGHPIGGDGGNEYNPQTEKENEKTFQMNESISVDIIEFGQQVLQFLKDTLTDPSSAGLSHFWREMGVSRGELFSLMADFAIIGYVGHKLVVITKNLAKKIKRLYHFLMDDEKEPQTQESIMLGNDLELGEADNYPLGAANDPNAPWNDNRNYTEPKRATQDMYDIVYINNEMSIFKGKDGGLYFFYYYNIDKNEFADYAEREEKFFGNDKDGYPDLEYGDFEIDADVIDRFVNANANSLSIGTTYDDYERGNFDLYKINNEIAVDIIKNWGGDEKLRNLFKVTRRENVFTKGELIETKMNPNFRKLKDKNGKIRKLTKNDADYKASEGDKKCGTCKFFKENNCDIIRGVIDKEMVCNYYDKKGDTNETTVAGASGDGGSSGPFVTPKVWAKDGKNWRNSNKPLYPSGQIVQNPIKEGIKLTHKQYKVIKENFDKTQWPNGEFIEFDDCVKFNNNKSAQNGGCSTGAIDGVVKTKKTSKSVISKEGLYYEIVAKKTGRTIDEVKSIIEGNLIETGFEDFISKLNPKNYKYQKPEDKNPKIEPETKPETKPETEPETSPKIEKEPEIEVMKREAVEAFHDGRDKKAQAIMKPYFSKFIGKSFSDGKITEIFIQPRENVKNTSYEIRIKTSAGIMINYFYYEGKDKLEGYIGEFTNKVTIHDDRQDGETRIIVPNKSAAALLSRIIIGLNPNTEYSGDSNRFIILGDSTSADKKWEDGMKGSTVDINSKRK